MLESSGEITAPCPVPFSLTVTTPSSRTPTLSHFWEQADDARVADPPLDEADQPFLAHRVEERPDVGVQYPVHLPAGDPDNERIHRIMRAAPGPEPVREPEEVFLVDRIQHGCHRPLDDLVLQGGDCQRALPTIRLGYVDPP